MQLMCNAAYILHCASFYTIFQTKTQLKAKSIFTNNFTDWKHEYQISVTSVLKASSSIFPPSVPFSVVPVESKEQLLTFLKAIHTFNAVLWFLPSKPGHQAKPSDADCEHGPELEVLQGW